MVFDYSKLLGRIVEKFGTRYKFAEAAGFTDPVLSSRLNCKTYWSQDEMENIRRPELLDFPAEEIPAYFFKPKFD